MRIQKITAAFTLLLTLTAMIGILLFSREISAGIRLGIEISLNSLIPSMFFFMGISNLIAEGTFTERLPFPHLLEKCFHLDRGLFTVFLLSLIGGYPVGAKLVGNEVRRGKITTEEGQRMLSFCVNCSPAFLISGVSLPLWKDMTPGIILYLSQVLAAVCMAIFSGRGVIRRKKSSTDLPVSFSVRLVESVKSAARSMGIICIFVVFFCAIFPLFDLLPLPETGRLLLKGLLEVTYGCQMIQNQSFYQSLFLVALFTSFGGICVHLQITALLSGSRMKMIPFFLSRICYTGLALLFAAAGSFLLGSGILPGPAADCFTSSGNINFEMYSVSPLSSILLLFLVTTLLLSRGKSVIIRNKDKH